MAAPMRSANTPLRCLRAIQHRRYQAAELAVLEGVRNDGRRTPALYRNQPRADGGYLCVRAKDPVPCDAC